MRLDDVAAAELADAIRALSEDAMLAIWHAQQVHAWTSNIIMGIEIGLEQAGIQRRKTDTPPAMCFFDITGYTRLTQEEGDAAAANLAEQLRRLVQRASVQHGGRAVKWLGDGVMFLFRDPGRGSSPRSTCATACARPGCRPPTWASTPGRSCSRRATTTGRR